MSNKLQSVFPMIRMREEILQEIQKNERLSHIFYNWEENFQEDFLDFCSGASGNRILYDAFFKEILSPEYAPERLGELLSLLLGREVKVLEILPADSTRLADETSLVIMDIVVELDDGSISNVEVQKIGYAFPGQRGACYSSDLLLRQYKRVRGEKGKKFSYRDIHKVYTIVFFEKSPKEFHKLPETWLHCSKQVFNTGLELDLLQEYVFIPLDIFQAGMQNRTIENKLEAWLSFFSASRPEQILDLIERYPEFRRMYEEIYTICQNVERVMGMFSEELRELDRNTVRYMMDEMQDELDGLKNEKNELQNEVDGLKGESMELQSKNGKLQNENGKLQNENGKLQDENSKLQDTIHSLKDATTEASVRAFINASRRYTDDMGSIAGQLMEEFSASQEEAEKMLERYW